MSKDTTELAATHPDAPPTVPEPVVDADDHTGQLLDPPPAGRPHVHTDTAGGWREPTGEEATAFAEEQEAKAKEAAEKAKAEAAEAAAAAPGATTPPAPTLGDRQKIADDFPGAAALEDADITTYGQVRKLIADDELTSVKGIGAATAAKIQEALGTPAATENQ